MKGGSVSYAKYLPYLLKAAAPYRKSYSRRNNPARGYRRKAGYARTKRRRYGVKRKRAAYKKRGKVAKNTRSIRKLQAHDRQSLGDMTYRALGSTAKVCNSGEQAVIGLAPNQVSTLEGVLAQCKFFNPATPGTLTTGSLATGTYQRNVRFENITGSATVSNNFGTTLSMKAYLCKVKDDTDQSPSAAWLAGIPDGSNKSTREDMGIYPSDFDLVKDLWDVKLHKQAILRPGQSMSVTHSTGAFEYSSSTVDSHNLSYQKEYKGFYWMFVFHGQCAHDTILTQIGNAQCGIDILYNTTYRVKYDAGVNIRFVHVDNSRDLTFTNLGVMGQTPVTDNQGYTVS